jgi:predicted transcriptional regulator
MKDSARDVLLLHLPAHLKAQVRDLARENRRSMTQEIVVSIQQRVERERTQQPNSQGDKTC